MPMQKKYTSYATSYPIIGPPVDFQTWCKREAETHPKLKYWSIVFDLELLVLEFVRSLREGNFNIYLQTLDQLAPRMFALDHNHYARWLPVHIRDMNVLKDKHPLIHREFQDGKFVVQKSKHVFSLIALDQNHEQDNESVKGVRGAIGLTENPGALQRWVISGPEVSHTVKEFESSFLPCLDNDVRHHEQVHGVQLSFAKISDHCY